MKISASKSRSIKYPTWATLATGAALLTANASCQPIPQRTAGSVPYQTQEEKPAPTQPKEKKREPQAVIGRARTNVVPHRIEPRRLGGKRAPKRPEVDYQQIMGVQVIPPRSDNKKEK